MPCEAGLDTNCPKGQLICPFQDLYISVQIISAYLVAITCIFRLSWEQHTHKGLVRVLEKLLVFCHHKVLVLDKEVVSLVAHTSSIMVYHEASL